MADDASTAADDDVASLSIKALKQRLADQGVDISGCSEKSELIALLREAESGAAASTAPANEPLDEISLEEALAKLSNLMDTLPASMQLLDKKWSESRQAKVQGQLKSVKALLDQTAAHGAGQPGWQSRLDEYNALARDFKRIRDLPRNMNG